jgi:polar amino acid transport system permease protein
VSFDFLMRYGPKLLEGLVVTIQIVALSIAIGMFLALFVAAARLSTNRIVAALAFAYVYFFRGTPLLAQLFLVYYGAGQFKDVLEAVGLWWFFRDPFNCTIFAFALNTAAYEGEIFRGAISSVPRGQWEAARALGIHRPVLLWKIVLPQAAMIALRPIGNDIILLIKDSAIASIVTVSELMGETRRAFSRSYDMTIYLYAAVLYLIVVESMRRVWNRLEIRLTHHLRRDAPAKAAPAGKLAPATH